MTGAETDSGGSSPRLVVLDRDGVINRDSKDFVKSVAEWQPLPGSLEAIGMLTRAGYTVCIASNQSGIGRGLFTRETLYGMHRKLRRLAAAHGGKVERIIFCPHRPEDGCACRKPEPGLLQELAAAFDVELDGVPVVGDSLRDIDAADAAGAMPVLVLTGNGPRTRAALQEQGRDVDTYDDLLAFAHRLVAADRPEALRCC